MTIRGLYKNPEEVPFVVLTKGPFNDVMDLRLAADGGLEALDRGVAKYVGTAYSDAQVALHSLTADWSLLGHSVMDEAVQQWIAEGAPLPPQNRRLLCNGDIMLHVNKGVFGLRIDNTGN